MPNPAPTPEPGAAPAPTPSPTPSSSPTPPALPAAAPSVLDTLYADDEPTAAAPGAPGASDAPPEDDAGDPPAPGEGGEPDAEGDAISTVEELIAQGEYDPEWFSSLKMNVKVDRQTKPVAIADLVKSYQIGAAAENRLEEARTAAKAITQEAAAHRDAMQTQLSVAATLVKSAEDMLDEDAKSIDWKTLRENDPAEYSAKRAEIAERRERIKALKEQGAQALRDAVTASRAKDAENFGAAIANAKTKLLEAIPEWSDKDKAGADIKRMTEFLVTHRGFSRDEIKGTIDHRLLVIARDAMLFHELQTKTDPARKKVVRVPKTLRPGPKDPPASRSTSLLDDLYGGH